MALANRWLFVCTFNTAVKGCCPIEKLEHNRRKKGLGSLDVFVKYFTVMMMIVYQLDNLLFPFSLVLLCMMDHEMHVCNLSDLILMNKWI